MIFGSEGVWLDGDPGWNFLQDEREAQVVTDQVHIGGKVQVSGGAEMSALCDFV